MSPRAILIIAAVAAGTLSGSPGAQRCGPAGGAVCGLATARLVAQAVPAADPAVPAVDPALSQDTGVAARAAEPAAARQPDGAVPEAFTQSDDIGLLPEERAGDRPLRIAASAGLLLLALIGAGLLAFRYRAGRGGRRLGVAAEHDEGGWPLQPLIVPPGLEERGSEPAAYRAGGPAPELRGPVPPAASAQLPAAPPAGARVATVAPHLAVVPGAAGAARARALRPRDGTLLRPDPVPEEVSVGQVHFHRPPEGTLQLLPGKLEIVGGTDAEEIRFVRVPGREPVITFGRSEGEPHTHVRLDAPTVSRLHAAIRFHHGVWHIENRSRTNPVVVNGVALPATGGGPQPLEDGDELEMGEVVFRFRAR